MTDVSRRPAEELDAADPLARWREEFVVADPDLVYLDGNSLGMTPRRTVDVVRDLVERQWAGDLITSWWEHDWLNLPLVVGDELAPLIGARAGEVAVHDSTTVCLFQLVNAALDLGDRSSGPATIAVEATEFPTDRYVAEGVARLRSGGDRPVQVRWGLDDLEGVSVVVRSLVDYRTARVANLAAETARAHDAGAITVWDLSHAVGVLPVDLAAAGAELAVGCTYKFLNGGPGAPAFTYVRSSLHEPITQPIWGWFGQTDQFAMDNRFSPRDGIGQILNGTPGVLGLVAARSGIGMTRQAGIAAIATKAAALSTYAIGLARALGLDCPTEPVPVSSGGHVVVRHPDAARLQAELAARKVIVDKRDPDVLRVGLSPLTTRFVDVHAALTTLAHLV